MCGINGVIHLNNAPVDKEQLLVMRDILYHRGPDSDGYFIDSNLGLGFRRLAILDLTDAGKQPMESASGRYVIVFNGEIYNYRSFYQELKEKGYTLKSSSDTEVLLCLYELYGPGMLERLNGMFAFAIWDRHERSLFLARDRAGVKPLYYAHYNNTILFASEPKAILAAGLPLAIDEDNVIELLLCRFVGGEHTLFKGIKKLLPGHYMTIKESGDLAIHRWWHLGNAIQQASEQSNAVKWYREQFDQSISLRMISDVPVGVLLSGGLDSGSICASVHHQKYQERQHINTFTIGFNNRQHDETEMAQRLAAKYGFTFNQKRLEQEDLHQHMIDATWSCDEPLVHLNEPHLLAISRMAKSKVSVLLSGEGADETLGGYVRYKPLRYPNLIRHFATLSKLGLLKGDRWRKLERYAAVQSKEQLVVFNASNFFPDEFRKVYGIEEPYQFDYRYQILQEAKQCYPHDLQRQALYYDQHLYLCSLLDRNDRTTMGASIECREPFLDPGLLTGLGKLPSNLLFTGKKGKYVLLEAMKDRLPKETVNFKKIGFSVPWAEYLNNIDCFKEELEQLKRSKLFTMKYLEHINIGQLVYQFKRGDQSQLPFIMPLLTFFFWYKYYATRLQTEVAKLKQQQKFPIN
ncbi:MAG TPA: asparagine synthase (glutamine-hydrolyzing) [Phnomibacter sp.]|nr:asparagine synthase (glutamine-hydrolyzing) [Phnomibacter sp.]